MSFNFFKEGISLRCILILMTLMMSTVWARAEDNDSRLQKLIGQYAQIQTVNLIARIHSTFYNSDSTVQMGNVYFAYTADHEKYNLISKSDSDNTVISRARYAYNGQRFQFLSMTTQQLFYQKADRDQIYLEVSNPFFYPVSFLDQSYDKHLNRAIKLTYVQNPSTLKTLLSNVVWQTISSNSPEVVAILPKFGTMAGRAFEYRIVFGGKINFLPTHIEMHYNAPDHSDLLDRIDLQNYGVILVDGNPFYWAKKIELTVYLNNQLKEDEQINVTSCEVNQPVNQNDFTIDFKLAKNILDWDTGDYLEVHAGLPSPTVIAGITQDKNPADIPEPASQPGQTNPEAILSQASQDPSVISIGDTSNPVQTHESLAIWLTVGAVMALILLVVGRLVMVKSQK